MEGLFAFFSFQNIVNIFVILGGVSAFIIYATQRRASVKSAFTMVINQIDGIEEVISKLRSTQADGKLCNEEVFKSDLILSRNFWSEYKHLIMRQLDQTDIKILDEFFYNAEQIELARKSIIKAMENGWHSKALAEQYILATYLSSGIDQKLSHLPGEQPDFTAIDSFVEQKCRLFSQTFEPRFELFTPNIPVSILVKQLNLYKPISTSVTYKKVKKCSYNK